MTLTASNSAGKWAARSASTLIFMAAALAALTAPVQAGIIASSTFDTGLGDWTSNTPSQIAWQSTGGNPGGYIQFTDASSASTVCLARSFLNFVRR
jgi:hypothetical protein